MQEPLHTFNMAEALAAMEAAVRGAKSGAGVAAASGARALSDNAKALMRLAAAIGRSAHYAGEEQIEQALSTLQAEHDRLAMSVPQFAPSGEQCLAHFARQDTDTTCKPLHPGRCKRDQPQAASDAGDACSLFAGAAEQRPAQAAPNTFVTLCEGGRPPSTHRGPGSLTARSGKLTHQRRQPRLKKKK
jgi:hypothetical protein